MLLFSVLALAPLSLCGAALLGHVERQSWPALTLRAAGLACLNCLLVVVGAWTLLVRNGPQTAELGWLALRLDGLSAIMLSLTTFIGTIVIRFSHRYLAGHPQHGRFVGRLCLTLAAVLGLVLAGNLVVLALSWVAISFALHGLLGLYTDRPRARLAANKWFWVAGLSDVALVGGCGMLFAALGTADIAALREAASAGLSPRAHVAVGLLGVAALLKSAQFPTHGWLLGIMELPTPVSALLHAGIVNAGGFLVVRFAYLFVASPTALLLLAVVGGTGAIAASAMMLTQPAAKTALTYSTVAQMGLMMFECGVGAMPVALLHIVAHSLYKAHAFLSAGQTAAILHTKSRFPAKLQVVSPGHVGLWCAAILLTAVAVAWNAPQHTIAVGLGAIVALGATSPFLHMAPKTSGSLRLASHGALAAVSVAVALLAYTGLKLATAWLAGDALPPIQTPDGIAVVVLITVAIGFASLMVAEASFLAGHRHAFLQSAYAQAAYVHLRNGLYVNVLFDRVAAARRASRPNPTPLPTRTLTH